LSIYHFWILAFAGKTAGIASTVAGRLTSTWQVRENWTNPVLPNLDSLTKIHESLPSGSDTALRQSIAFAITNL
jgi:hypothetical protein